MNVMSPNNMHTLYHSSLDIVKGGFGHKDRILNAFFFNWKNKWDWAIIGVVHLRSGTTWLKDENWIVKVLIIIIRVINDYGYTPITCA